MTRLDRSLITLVAVIAVALTAACVTEDVATSSQALVAPEHASQCPAQTSALPSYARVTMMPGLPGPAPMEPSEECDEPELHTDEDHDGSCDHDLAPIDLAAPAPAGDPVPGTPAPVVQHCEWSELTACGAPIMDSTNTTAVGCNETWTPHTCKHKAPTCGASHGKGSTYCRASKSGGVWGCTLSGNQTRHCAAK